MSIGNEWGFTGGLLNGYATTKGVPSSTYLWAVPMALESINNIAETLGFNLSKFREMTEKEIEETKFEFDGKEYLKQPYKKFLAAIPIAAVNTGISYIVGDIVGSIVGSIT